MNVRVKGVSKQFDNTCALVGIDLEVGEDVSALTLIGPSGSGKSTLLRVLGGLECPEQGSLHIDGEVVDFSSEANLLAHRRRNGFLFQSFNLFPHMTALENVVLPLETVHGQDREQASATAITSLERFGLGSHLHKYPAQLSGGEQQRAAIARAVAPQPGLLFLDEPTSALDPEMTGEVLDLIAELKDGGQNIVLSTHEMGFAREVSDEIVFLAGGKILARGTPAYVFDNADTPRLRQFLARVMRY